MGCLINIEFDLFLANADPVPISCKNIKHLLFVDKEEVPYNYEEEAVVDILPYLSIRPAHTYANASESWPKTSDTSEHAAALHTPLHKPDDGRHSSC